MASTCAKSRTSQLTPSPCAPLASSSLTDSSSTCWRRPVTTSRAPSSPNRSAMLLPRPEPPPVTTITLSCSRSLWNTAPPSALEVGAGVQGAERHAERLDPLAPARLAVDQAERADHLGPAPLLAQPLDHLRHRA